MNKKIKPSTRKILAMCLVLIMGSQVVACSNKDAENSNAADTNSEQRVDTSQNNKTDSNATAEKSGSVITIGNTAFEIFNENKAGEKEYSQIISQHKKALGKDVQVYNMVVPTHVEFGLPEKYKDMSKSEKDSIDSIYKNMDKDVKTVDAYDNLKKHKDEYIYFNTDHHWTSLGAYYAYQSFAKEAGFKPVELSNYDKYTKEGFLGTLYAQTQDSKIKNNPDKVDYYKIPCDYSVYRYEKENPNKPLKTTLYADYAKGSNAYSVFLHGDFPRIDIKNKDAKNNKKLVVVKESYGNAFVPFLIPHYKEVIVIDSRHYKGSLEKLVKENNANEVLFINNAFAANTQKIVNTIKDLNK